MNKTTIQLAASLILACLFILPLNAGQGEKYNPIPHKKIFKIEPGKRLHLKTNFKNVEISGWERNEVHLQINGYEKIKNHLKFDTNFTEHKLKIEVTADFSANPDLYDDIIYVIKVPINFHLDIFNEKGGIEIKDINGDNNLVTFDGNISIINSKGNSILSSTNGNIIFYNTSGNYTFSTAEGMVIGRDFSGNVSVSTLNGDIDLSGNNSVISAATFGGNINLTYSGENKGIELFSTAGKITLNLPENFDASANLISLKGKISYDIALINPLNISKSNLDAIINKGGNKLTAKTFNGDIEIRKNKLTKK